MRRLKRENAELRRANAILKVGFLRGRARPAREAVIRFIAEHKDHRESDCGSPRIVEGFSMRLPGRGPQRSRS